MKDSNPEILSLIFDRPGFVACTLKARLPRRHDKARVRPVKLDNAAFQVTLTGGLAAETANLDAAAARTTIADYLDTATDAHVMTETGDLHVRLTKKGVELLSRSRPLERPPAADTHDRAKEYPLTRFDSARLLRAIGLSDDHGKILPSMQAKYRQVNEFLRVLDTVVCRGAPVCAPLQLVDVGCGKAYLSFAALAYLQSTRPFPVTLTGIDRRSDIIASCVKTADALALDNATFIAADIAALGGQTPSLRPSSFQPLSLPAFQPSSEASPRLIVLALHACDDATDEAIAFGIERRADAILVAPCCQHDVQKDLSASAARLRANPSAAILKNGILRERFADILADTFRAQLLRIHGYRTTVLEFVSPDATGRNLMIRAERGARPNLPEALAEYADLKAAWGVLPRLEQRLKSC